MKKSKNKKGSTGSVQVTPGVRLRTSSTSTFAGGTRCGVRNCGAFVEDGVCDHGHLQVLPIEEKK